MIVSNKKQVALANKPFARISNTGSIAVNIQKKYYSMASTDGTSAEITMYGEIVETQPVDWWTGEPIEGQYITQSEFMEDLEAIASCKDITIRMDSLGGNAGVAILIHNRLRELAANGANLTCIVDGVAMSGGSLIMCACDNVKVNPSSLIMIHKCWCFLFGGYNADDLRSVAESNDAYDKAQASIYARKTKLSETKIMHMMSDTTYMTGAEAVDKGFADELLYTEETLDIAASSDGKSLYVRGRKMHLAAGMTIPDNIPKVKAAENTDDNKTNNAMSEGVRSMNGQNVTHIRRIIKKTLHDDTQTSPYINTALSNDNKYQAAREIVHNALHGKK